LVKTAFYGGDANWGRILAAVGYSGATVDPARADLWIAAGTGLVSAQGDYQLVLTDRLEGLPLQLVGGGQPLAYSEEAASAIFAGPEITVAVNLELGAGRATVWTCDLSHEYVSINGHYRT
jgi:glutamate N-acetyltransferase/amino-acid N-acetyltransferase